MWHERRGLSDIATVSKGGWSFANGQLVCIDVLILCCSGEASHRRLPLVTVIPTFPKDVQARLDTKELCHTIPKICNKIIRTLYEMMAEYTL